MNEKYWIVIIPNEQLLSHPIMSKHKMSEEECNKLLKDKASTYIVDLADDFDLFMVYNFAITKLFFKNKKDALECCNNYDNWWKKHHNEYEFGGVKLD